MKAAVNFVMEIVDNKPFLSPAKSDLACLWLQILREMVSIFILRTMILEKASFNFASLFRV